MKTQEIYEKVNQVILDELAQGVVPWERPWGADGQFAHNGYSRKNYTGCNFFTMNFLAQKYGAVDFYTFNQIQELGGHIRKGERGHLVTFYKVVSYRDPSAPSITEDGEIENIKTIPMLRYYVVWNRNQVEGLPEAKNIETKEINPIEAAEKIVACYPGAPRIIEDHPQAYYSPSGDYVNMPKRNTFKSAEGWYSTLFHELTHSTGHKSRLDRFDGAGKFGSESYGREELVAELGACYLRSVAGIERNYETKQSASYIAGWSKAIKDDPQMFFKAASAAQKAADYILNGKQPEIKTAPILAAKKVVKAPEVIAAPVQLELF